MHNMQFSKLMRSRARVDTHETYSTRLECRLSRVETRVTLELSFVAVLHYSTTAVCRGQSHIRYSQSGLLQSRVESATSPGQHLAQARLTTVRIYGRRTSQVAAV